jgi:hypothetical protein
MDFRTRLEGKDYAATIAGIVARNQTLMKQCQGGKVFYETPRDDRDDLVEICRAARSNPAGMKPLSDLEFMMLATEALAWESELPNLTESVAFADASKLRVWEDWRNRWFARLSLC